MARIISTHATVVGRSYKTESVGFSQNTSGVHSTVKMAKFQKVITGQVVLVKRCILANLVHRVCETTARDLGTQVALSVPETCGAHEMCTTLFGS